MSYRILIAEDEREIADFVFRYLKKEGYRVDIKYRGDDALAMILTDPPDLVILDIMLPGMDGLEVLRRMREKMYLPVILLTSVMILPLANPPDVRKKFRTALVRSFIMAVLISSLVALFLARTLTKPIRAMENKALQISKGDFSKKLNLRRKDEIGALAYSFDEMSE